MNTGATLTVIGLVLAAGFLLAWVGFIIGQMTPRKPAVRSAPVEAPKTEPTKKAPVPPPAKPRATYHPPPPRRGACGMKECPILKPHSHALDLCKLIEREKKK